MVNKIFIQGNITKDIELKQTQNNISVCAFDIAYNMTDHTDYFRVECWKKLAENVSKYCKKGSKVLVEGRLATESYEKDGQKKTYYKIVAYAVEFLDSKKGNGSSESTEDTQKNNDIPDLPF